MGLTRPKAYQLLDSDYKASCRAATTNSVTLSGGAPSTLDTSVTLAKGDRILVKNQSTESDNGIYIVQTLGSGSNGTWIRANDFNETAKISSGIVIYVEEGAANGDTIFTLTTNGPITLGSTSLTFTALTSGAAATSSIVNGNSNVVVAANANVTISSTGNANVVTITGIGANITGSLEISGQISSTLTTGTAPFVVTSTTQVANLNVAASGTATSATTAGTVTTAAQPNITSVGTLTSLGVNGTITGTQLISNITTGTAPFVVTSTTQVANLNVATAGTATSATTAGTVTTAAQPNITSVGNLTIANIDNIQIDGNTISSTNTNGNINISPNGTGNVNLNDPVQVTSTVQATRFISNITTGTAPFTVTSTTQVANLNVATAGSATTAGTVTTAAQPNITSVGNLTIANVDNIQIDGNTISSTNTNGNIDISPNGTGNINLNDPVQATSTIQATRFISNITTGTAPFTVTSTTQVANLNVATAGTAGSATTAGTVTTAAQPNITSVGTLSSLIVSGDTTVGGNLTVNGTTTTINATEMKVTDLNIVVANGAVSAAAADGAGITVDGAAASLTYVNASNSWQFDRAAGANGTITGTQLISNITTGTAPLVVSSTTQVANLNVATAGSATTAGTVTTAAQPNITSVGTLTSLGVNGTITGTQLISNITTGTAPFTVTSTTQVANLNVATAGSATTAGTVTTAAQPNITSVGTLTSLGVNGTITGTQLISNITTGTAPFTVTSTTQVANLNVATAGSATTAGTVTTAAQPNITSVGTLTSLGVNGTITGTRLISNIATGTAPLTVSSTTQVANLNVATAGSAVTLSTTRSDWSTNGVISAVVGQLSWKEYGNGHTIFDASDSTSPAGGAVGNTNPDVAWTGTYPTLMGWNGSSTYGVRVDSARYSDQSKYADLAEKYIADKEYTVGTVLMIGGEAEVTIATKEQRTIVGVVSENGFIMNSDLTGENVLAIGYIGRVPCRVKGTVNRGDMLVVGDTPGVAIATEYSNDLTGKLIGKALENYNSDTEGLIEILVGRL